MGLSQKRNKGGAPTEDSSSLVSQPLTIQLHKIRALCVMSPSMCSLGTLTGVVFQTHSVLIYGLFSQTLALLFIYLFILQLFVLPQYLCQDSWTSLLPPRQCEERQENLLSTVPSVSSVLTQWFADKKKKMPTRVGECGITYKIQLTCRQHRLAAVLEHKLSLFRLLSYKIWLNRG